MQVRLVAAARLAALVLVGALVAGGGLAGCTDGGEADAGALPACSQIQPPAPHPSGPCQAGELCGHPPPEGWSCRCAANLQWDCQYVGMERMDLARWND